MIAPSLTFHRFVSGFFFPRSYSLKFLGIAFLGIHLPLLALVGYLAATQGWEHSLSSIFVVLTATLVGTAVTLVSQHYLLAPVRCARDDLERYRLQRAQPRSVADLPDEAGRLMAETRACIENLDQLLHLKDQLVASMAHDLRSPLTGIMLAADAISMDRAASPTIRNYADRIRRTTAAQADHINALLDAVMAETDVSAEVFAPVELARVWQSSADSVWLAAETKGVQLTFVPTDLVVGANEARLTQVINNLVSNAIKAASQGDRVTVTALLDASSDVIRVEVSDTGPGIDPTLIQRALSGSSAEAPTEGGLKMGIGLRLVKALLALQASRLEITREVAGGMCFSFGLKRVSPV